VDWWLLPAAVAVPTLLGLSVLLYLRRPPEPLWPVAFICQVSALLWAVGDLATHFSTDLAQEARALTLLYTGSIPTAAAWWILAVRYARIHTRVPAWLAGPAIEAGPAALAAAGWLAFATHPWHGQFVTPVVGGPNLHHAGFWATVSFSYAEVAGASVLFAWVARRQSARERHNAWLLAGATMAPLAANAAYLFVRAGSTLDFTALGLCVTSAAVLFGVRWTGLFRLQPVALAEVLRRDPNGVLLVVPGGRLLFWNPAAERTLPGLALAADLEVVPRLAERLLHEDGSPVDPVRLVHRLLGARPQSGGEVFAYASGTPDARWLQLSAARIPGRSGRLAAIQLRVGDVSRLRRIEQERRALEAELRRAEKLGSLGLLAGGVAHDFNNLLTAILGNTALALRSLEPGMAPRHHLEEIQLAARQAADLTEQLLAYAGRAPRNEERVNLSRLVQEMSRLLELSMGRDGRIGLDLDPTVPLVEGDPGQLGQVVMNLVANAAEAVAGRPGLVRVATRRAPPPPGSGVDPGAAGVLLEVADDGVGMDGATRSRIFDPFFTTRSEGRGLGLAVVHGLVSAHAGAIDVESEPGSGTCVRVWLPAARVAASDREPRRERAGPARAGRWVGAGSVLVADDQPTLRRMLRSVLASLGFDVVVAAGGAEALARFRELRGQLRLVILDLTMPDLNGDEVLREIREVDPELPVILSTGFAERDVRALLDGQKNVELLQKPYELRELVGVVRRMLPGPAQSRR
jgi:signal transduction histidine kinase